MKLALLGGGQLARMLALAAHPLGLRTSFLDPAPDACAAALAEHHCAPFDDQNALRALLKDAAAVSFEFEHIPPATLEFLSQFPQVQPHPKAVQVAQDRLREKLLFRSLDIPAPPFVSIDQRADLERAARELGLQLVLKTRLQGYDGKGQRVLRSTADVEPAWRELSAQALLAEGFIAFEREVSMIGVRGRDGDCRFYPLTENIHRQGILHLSRPRIDDALQSEGENYTRRILEHLDYVGVLACEFFVHEGKLLANEIAPRVHNSGHWTIEGAETSQFENHLRAILGLPLGATTPLGYSAMVNFIGTLPAAERVLAIPGAHLHAYGKQNRPGRKVGHATLRSTTLDELELHLPALLIMGSKP